MASGLRIRLNRAAASSLTDQISHTIREAVLEGRLGPGARLPSWRDLAAQLGVARGTVRAAYERLIDELLIVASGPAGTHVADEPPRAATAVELEPALRARTARYPVPARPFQMGIPAHDGFPVKQWTRVMVRAARASAATPASYPDPCGIIELRAQIAGYLALARGIRCVPEQITITRGYRDGLNFAIRALGVERGAAWMEDPGYPVTRIGLTLAGMRPVSVPVDSEGLRVQRGVALAPDAALAVVTAGQQAPLGVTLSSERRQALVRWAHRSGAWILEDDYLSELQLRGRAAPAVMAMEHASRVIYAGTFSKTMGPSLGIGFVVAPPAVAARFVEVAECLAPAPSPVVQLALAEFLRDGHYLRHLRRMKRLYAARRDALLARLTGLAGVEAIAGLAVLLRLPRGSDDAALARAARTQGLAPGALSAWYATEDRRAPGLLLGVTNLVEPGLQRACDRLRALVASPY
jgi:GntR family transcriptional regulator/MocR family aminotransferase